MTYFKSFLSLWHSIKKILRLLTDVSESTLANATVLPWALNFIKSFSEAYRKNKRKRWDYLIAHFPCEELPNKEEKRRYLIEQLNASLLTHSPDKKNPWAINDTNQNFIEIKKQCCLELEKQLQQDINDIELANCRLTQSQKQYIKKYLYNLAALAHFTHTPESQTSGPITLIHLSQEETLEKFKKLHQKNYRTIQKKLKRFNKLQNIANNKSPSIYFSSISGSETISLTSPTFWEKANRFANKNPIFQFFAIVWNTASSHANLLKWISFFLVVFSLSLYFFPYIVLGVFSLAAGYLILQCALALRNTQKPISPNLLTQEEEASLIQIIKQEVFNKERYKQELAVIQSQLSNATLDITKFSEHFLALKKTVIIQFLQELQLQKSSIYQRLSQVYPKTQFIASLVINLTSVIVYGYLISWATSALFTVIGVSSLAGFLASPLGIGLLILIPACFFLVRHLIRSRSREDHYQNKIHSLLNAQCDYIFTDIKGKTQQIKLEKWKKF